MLQGYLSGLPAFLAYFATAGALVLGFGLVYVQVTAHREFALIRQGNLAAVPAFLGALVGFVLPLTTAMRFSVSWVDFVIWGVIAALVQIAAYFLARALMPDVSRRIVDGEIAGGAWLGGIALVFGMVNAASMTP
jgi:putative membrane protein